MVVMSPLVAGAAIRLNSIKYQVSSRYKQMQLVTLQLVIIASLTPYSNLKLIQIEWVL